MWKRREAMQVTGAAGDSRCFAKAEKPASRRGSLAEARGKASWVGGLDASQPYHALSRAPIRNHAPHNRVRRLIYRASGPNSSSRAAAEAARCGAQVLLSFLARRRR